MRPQKPADKEWAKLDDYSPPISTLDASDAKPLEVQWGTHPMNFDADPDVQHMHPQEIEIAAKLRLPPDRYLANKRRIFIAKVDCLRKSRNFTKTLAQKACNIDVNKVGQLYDAFEKSGWFRREHFEICVRNAGHVIYPPQIAKHAQYGTGNLRI